MKTEIKIIVLVSGGIDSVTALYHANKNHNVVAGISFDYGSKHNHCEIPYAKLHCEKLKIQHHVISLDFIDQLFNSHLLKSGHAIPDGHYEDNSMKQTVVPFRNGIMLAIAAGYAESCGAEALLIAAHDGDHAIYPDCRESFMQSMSSAIKLGTYSDIKLFRPFISYNKTDIVKLGDQLGVNYKQTWSCYKGMDQHCGICGTCTERKEAFQLAGLKDPTVYLESTDYVNQ